MEGSCRKGFSSYSLKPSPCVCLHSCVILGILLQGIKITVNISYILVLYSKTPDEFNWKSWTINPTIELKASLLRNKISTATLRINILPRSQDRRLSESSPSPNYYFVLLAISLSLTFSLSSAVIPYPFGLSAMSAPPSTLQQTSSKDNR